MKKGEEGGMIKGPEAGRTMVCHSNPGEFGVFRLEQWGRKVADEAVRLQEPCRTERGWGTCVIEVEGIEAQDPSACWESEAVLRLTVPWPLFLHVLKGR